VRSISSNGTKAYSLLYNLLNRLMTDGLHIHNFLLYFDLQLIWFLKEDYLFNFFLTFLIFFSSKSPHNMS